MQSPEIQGEAQVIELANELIDEVEGNAFVSLFFDDRVRRRYECLKESLILNGFRDKDTKNVT